MVEKPKARPKGSTPTRRDEAIFTDLYLSRYLTTNQIAKMYFVSNSGAPNKERTSVEAADRRLQRLASHGWIVAHKHLMTGPTTTRKLWSLTESSFERQREILSDNKEAKAPQRPPLANLEHRIGISDIYRDCSMAFRMLLDEPTLDMSTGIKSWSWYHEGKIDRSIMKNSGTQKLKPDAELHTPGLIFFIEYQTEDSRIGNAAMNDKISNYERYITHLLPEQTDAEPHLVVATDASWVVEATTTRAKELNFKAIAGNLGEATSYIIDTMSDKALSTPVDE